MPQRRPRPEAERDESTGAGTKSAASASSSSMPPPSSSDRFRRRRRRSSSSTRRGGGVGGSNSAWDVSIASRSFDRRTRSRADAYHSPSSRRTSSSAVIADPTRSPSSRCRLTASRSEASRATAPASSPPHVGPATETSSRYSPSGTGAFGSREERQRGRTRDEGTRVRVKMRDCGRRKKKMERSGRIVRQFGGGHCYFFVIFLLHLIRAVK